MCLFWMPLVHRDEAKMHITTYSGMDVFATARKVRLAVQRVAREIEMREFRMTNDAIVSLCASVSPSDTG